jgi:SAM-dependent methyltransferase
MSDLLHREITQSYYLTTASRGHSPTQGHYNRVADGLLRRLGPWMPKSRSARCLDLACGCGETLYMLERQGFRDTAGVDLCAEEIEQAQAFIRGRLYCSDALSFLKTAESHSFDFVTALNFLEHLNKDSLLEVLRECARVLRPGGVMVAIVPNATSPFGGMTRYWDITHEWAFVPNNLQQIARLTGFGSEVEFRECRPIMHGLKSGIRYLAWQIIRAMIATYLVIETANTKGGVYTMDMMVRMTANTPSVTINH